MEITLGLFEFSLIAQFLIGVGFIITGSIGLYRLDYYEELTKDLPYLREAAITLIVIGIILILLVFFGFFGSIRAHWLFLGIFCLLIIIILIGMIVLGSLFIHYRKDTKIELKMLANANNAMNSFETSKNNDFVKGTNKFQDYYQCCGYNDKSTYKGNNVQSNYVLPKGCCEKDESCTESEYGTNGCHDDIVSWVKKQVNIDGGVAIGLSLLLLAPAFTGLIKALEFKRG
ncbi:hypothetical protein SNEBB_001529 [Seison nebaliae]|nr:hypothetical protein SNEBB_001529 [Seison nebaliae]